MVKCKEARVFVDGASRGNPGPAAVGVVFQDATGRVIKSLSLGIGRATNNVAEYCALLLAFQEALMLGISELEIFTDSELLARQFNGEYKVKDDLLKIFHGLAGHLRHGFKNVRLSHVPREQNKLADREANRALDEDWIL
jgi:ribonuclease HI